MTKLCYTSLPTLG